MQLQSYLFLFCYLFSSQVAFELYFRLDDAHWKGYGRLGNNGNPATYNPSALKVSLRHMHASDRGSVCTVMILYHPAPALQNQKPERGISRHCSEIRHIGGGSQQLFKLPPVWCHLRPPPCTVETLGAINTPHLDHAHDVELYCVRYGS